jgi:hypothetical protein
MVKSMVLMVGLANIELVNGVSKHAMIKVRWDECGMVIPCHCNPNIMGVYIYIYYMYIYICIHLSLWIDDHTSRTIAIPTNTYGKSEMHSKISGYNQFSMVKMALDTHFPPVSSMIF